jgi:hypothetical protein
LLLFLRIAMVGPPPVPAGAAPGSALSSCSPTRHRRLLPLAATHSPAAAARWGFTSHPTASTQPPGPPGKKKKKKKKKKRKGKKKKKASPQRSRACALGRRRSLGPRRPCQPTTPPGGRRSRVRGRAGRDRAPRLRARPGVGSRLKRELPVAGQQTDPGPERGRRLATVRVAASVLSRAPSLPVLLH